jgi:hypothetical protein
LFKEEGVPKVSLWEKVEGRKVEGRKVEGRKVEGRKVGR